MGKIIGRLTSVGLGKESTRGTAVAPTTWVPVQAIDIDDKAEYIDNDSGFGNIAEFNDSDVNTVHAEGGYEGKVFDNASGLELYAVFGQSPTSVQRAATGVYDHTFALLNGNQHGSLTVGYKDDLGSIRYALAMVDEYTIEATLDKYLTRKIKFQSKPSVTSSDTVSYTAGNEFLAKHLAVKLASAQGGLDAATAIKAMSFNFTVKKNLNIEYVFGSTAPDDIVNQQVNVDGEFELDRVDNTYRTLHLNGTKQALRLEAINTGVTIGGVHNPAIRFDFPTVIAKEHTRNWDANAVLGQTIKFQANYSLTDAAIITARLTNTATSY